jgi:predicted CoA-binding protein
MNLTEQFLSADRYAVAGASTNREKYGNQVFRALIESGRNTFPLNPNAEEVEGHVAFESLERLPVVPQSLSIITPPAVTKVILQEAIRIGVENVWMQPGAEHPEASEAARDAGLNVIDDGSCLLVVLKFAGK